MSQAVLIQYNNVWFADDRDQLLHANSDRYKQEGGGDQGLWYLSLNVEAEANTRDRFLIIKDNINKNFFYIKTKLDERERKRGDAQQINADIRLKIQEIYNQLERMRETVASEKGTNVQPCLPSQQLKLSSTMSSTN
jgi:hypothetical protein